MADESRRDRIGQALRIYAMAHGWSHLSPSPDAEWDDMAEHRKERWRSIADVVLADVDSARADGRKEGLEEAAACCDELATEHRKEAVKYMKRGDNEASDSVFDAALGYEASAAAIRALKEKA